MTAKQSILHGEPTLKIVGTDELANFINVNEAQELLIHLMDIFEFVKAHPEQQQSEASESVRQFIYAYLDSLI